VKHCLRNLVVILFLLLSSVPAWAGKGVVLNFSDVDISTMVKFISDLTGKNFILDERVKGKISVYSPAKLSTDEAYNVFTSVLELKGFTVIPAGKVNKIVPLASARQSGTRVVADHDKGAVNDAYQARIITLGNISAQDAVAFLQPVVSRDGHIAPFGPGNMLLVVDSAINIQKLLGILEFIDTPQRREGAELLFLKNAPADGVATLVKDWLGGRDKGQKSSGTPATGGGIVIPDTRLNALVVFGTDKDKEDIKRLVALVDISPPTTSAKINVYFLEYADAVEMVKVLDGFIKGAGVQATTGQQTGATPGQQSPFEGSKISVIADKPTNSLVIAASPNDYQSLLGVIQKLDKRRRQVYVQATIAEISLNKADAFGTQLAALVGGTTGNAAGAIAVDPFNLIGSSSPATLAIIKVLTSLGKNTNLVGAVNALTVNGALNLLSTPNILTSDNKEAEIFVGENVPFLGSTTTVGGTSNTLQSVERKDTGITLRITPQITEGDYIKMDIYQEISAVKTTTKSATTVNPQDLVTTKRSAKTSVVVKNDETIVIGGLIQGQETETLRKVPLLGDIPLLGWLFKTKETTTDKTNLIILLTPRVVKDAATMNTLTDKQRERFNEFVQDSKPIDIPAEINRKP
jgi:general secretion pathway protein D